MFAVYFFAVLFSVITIVVRSTDTLYPDEVNSPLQCETIDAPLSEFETEADVATYYSAIVHCGFGVFNEWIDGVTVIHALNNVVSDDSMFAAKLMDGDTYCITWAEYGAYLQDNIVQIKNRMANLRNTIDPVATSYDIEFWNDRNFVVQQTRTFVKQSDGTSFKIKSFHAVSFDDTGRITKGFVHTTTDSEYAVVGLQATPNAGNVCDFDGSVIYPPPGPGSKGSKGSKGSHESSSHDAVMPILGDLSQNVNNAAPPTTNGYYLDEGTLQNALIICLVIGLSCAALMITYQNCGKCGKNGAGRRYKTVSMDSSAAEQDDLNV